VFCAKNKKAIYGYGEPYIIYPKDGFRFYYSNEIEDIYYKKFFTHSLRFVEDEELQACLLLFMLNEASYNDKLIGKSNAYHNILKDKFGEYNNKNIKDYIKYIEKKYPKSAETFVKRYYKKSTNLNDIKNVKSRNEIMIICKGYYSIKA